MHGNTFTEKRRTLSIQFFIFSLCHRLIYMRLVLRGTCGVRVQHHPHGSIIIVVVVVYGHSGWWWWQGWLQLSSFTFSIVFPWLHFSWMEKHAQVDSQFALALLTRHIHTYAIMCTVTQSVIHIHYHTIHLGHYPWCTNLPVFVFFFFFFVLHVCM